MTTTIVKRNQFNTVAFGERLFNSPFSTTVTLPTIPSNNRRTMHSGWGHYGERVWGRSYEYSLRTPTTTLGETAPTIVFTNSAGAIIGTLRTDVQKSIFRSIEFTILKGDCRDFKLTLNKQPSFPLLPFSYISIQLRGATEPWYFGRIKEAPEPGDNNLDSYVYTGNGLSESLSGINGDELEFTAGTDIGEIVYYLAYNRIATETKITILDSLIDQSTRIELISDITLDKTSLSKAMDAFASMCGYNWGVDGSGRFFFLEAPSSYVNTWYVGYNLQKFNLSQNLQSVKNRIIGKRTSLPGSGTTGWVIGAISNDESSQRKYGTIEDSIQVPGNFSDDDIQLLTDALLEQKKEPQLTSKSTTYTIRDQTDFVDRGYSKFILPFALYDEDYNRCDDPETDYTKSGGGDTLISQDEVEYIDGQSSLKLIWTSGDGDVVQTEQTLKGALKRLRFYYRSGVSGLVATVGIGNGLWNEYEWNINVPVGMTGFWLPYDLDLSGYNIKKITKLGFQIQTADSGQLNIDRISFQLKASRHITLENTKQIYKFGPDMISIEMEHGPIVKRLENYLSALFAQVEEATITGEIQ